MNALTKGLILAGVQTLMVLSVGGKMLLDRATLPRLWVRVAPYDPNVPLRGRYVSLTVNAEPRGFSEGTVYGQTMYSVEDGKLVARPAPGEGHTDRSRALAGILLLVGAPGRRAARVGDFPIPP